MSSASERRVARVFSALGDDTRLALVKRLGGGEALSATVLAARAEVTRQAIVKHLQVLEAAGLVSHEKRGREVLYALEPEHFANAKSFLDTVSTRWDEALERLRAFVEEPRAPSTASRPRTRRPRTREVRVRSRDS